MNKLLRYFAVAVLIAGCSESAAPTPLPDNGKDTDPDTPTACKDMSCAQGCCDGQCVDFRTDKTHCGRCETQCAYNQYCNDGKCSKDCENDHPRICAGVCVNASSNESHCGGCGKACGANMVCDGGKCACAPGYADCDGDAANGCESESAACECTPGEERQCYTYADGKPGVGVCRYGVETCKVVKGDGYDDIYWGGCVGEVGPTYVAEAGQTLDLTLDNNCDGVIDGEEDYDKDGYTRGQGDCCDSLKSCDVKIECREGYACSVDDPAGINPGQSDSARLDANCDGKIDENAPAGGEQFKNCSVGSHKFTANSQLTASDAELLAKAMNICDGLVSAQLLLADGSALPLKGNSAICGTKLQLISPAEQVAVAEDLGGIVKPVDIKIDGAVNANMVILSSGKAAGKENTSDSQCVGTEVTAPAVFLNAHGGALPASSVCGNERKDTRANDSIMLRLKLKAPQNAKSFSFRFKFFSKEYPKYVCDKYNDFFLALVDSPTNEKIPKDHNVAFDENKNPVSVNNAFFTECDKAACTAEKGCSACSDGTDLLAGYFDTQKSGATAWLQTSVPVSGNEEFTLDLMIFDAGEPTGGSTSSGYGHQKDSLVLIDAFAWGTESTNINTRPIIN